jgi:Leucine-rich repeat (LRR) protein
MRKLFGICLLLLYSWIGFSQSDSVKVYNWSELGNADPDTIYGISFSKIKLTEVPEDLAKYRNLKILDLSKNKLTSLPQFIGDLNSLEELNLSKNDFEVFPVEICKLTNLERLIANRNPFDNLPECIEYCSKLEYMDLWETPISSFPNSIVNLKSLKEIDLQGIRYGPTFQKEIKKKIPWVTIKFDPPCDCME